MTKDELIRENVTVKFRFCCLCKHSEEPKIVVPTVDLYCQKHRKHVREDETCDFFEYEKKDEKSTKD